MEIEILNETVHYLVENTGKQKVLFIHGFTSRKEAFIEPIINKKRDFDIVALDLVCHGETSCNTPSLPHMFKVVSEFVKKLKLNNLIVVGHSMGGPIALSLLKLPQIKEVLLLSPLNYKVNFKKSVLEMMLPKTIKNALIMMKSLIKFEHSEESNKTRATSYLKGVMAHYKELYSIGIKEMCNKKFQINVLKPLYTENTNYQIICGTADLIIPVKSIEEVAKENGVKLVTVDGAGHIITIDANELVLDAINTLVNKSDIENH